MRCIIVVLIILWSNDLFAQLPNINRFIADFDKALLSKDSTKLKGLLSDHITYGHSNGWIQNKKEVINDLYNGKITYKSISSSNEDVKIYGNTAFVRMNSNVQVEVEGKQLELNLSVLQVWMLIYIDHKQRWELFARQSVKI